MSCLNPMPRDIDGNVFLDDLDGRAGAGDLPLAGSLELTHGCNLHCRHCYIPRSTPEPREMDTAAIGRILEKMADGGILFLLMTGGEPLLRPDFEILYRRAKDLGFLISLYTNATRVTDRIADLLAAYPPRRLEVTVYGHTRETYLAISGVEQGFDDFREGLGRLAARRLGIQLKAMILRDNQHEIEAMRRWAEEDMNLPFRVDALVNPRLDGDPGPLDQRLAPEAAARLLEQSAPGGSAAPPPPPPGDRHRAGHPAVPLRRGHPHGAYRSVWPDASLPVVAIDAIRFSQRRCFGMEAACNRFAATHPAGTERLRHMPRPAGLHHLCGGVAAGMRDGGKSAGLPLWDLLLSHINNGFIQRLNNPGKTTREITMMQSSPKQRKPYVKPEVTRVKLDDRRVVAMAVCKDSLDNNACAQDGVTPLFQINPS